VRIAYDNILAAPVNAENPRCRLPRAVGYATLRSFPSNKSPNDDPPTEISAMAKRLCLSITILLCCISSAIAVEPTHAR